jgi:hypothetical protein
VVRFQHSHPVFQRTFARMSESKAVGGI